MRPSSSHSDLFDGVLAAGPVRAEVTGAAWLRAMLDVEAALARVQARLGLIPAAAGDAITAACGTGRFDEGALAADSVGAGNPVEPLVRALRRALPDEAASAVHKGATSQDILDTATMLVVRRSWVPLLADLHAAADRAADLAAVHRRTLMPARTLMQQALPTTFGLVAAGWLTALDAAARRLAEVGRAEPAVQFGGAAGTLAALGPRGIEVMDALAAELDLAVPVLPWHTDRTRIAAIAGALGAAAGTLAKVARDVTLHAQTEVGEVRDAVARGGSSTLAHKRNPVAAVAAVAGAAQAPGLVATLLAAMPQEYQRAAGGWHAEWRPLRALLESVGSAAHWLRNCLDNLEVDVGRMRANLDATGGALLAERVSGVLAERMGTAAAHERVREAVASGRPLAEAFDVQPTLLDPAGYLGSAPELVDRALLARGGAVPLHHVVDGPDDAPPLVLLNSLGSDGRIWDAVVPALASRWRVIRIDTRGHGDSPVPPGPYTVDDLGADVLGVLDRLGVANANLCGISLGGIVGMWLAATVPARVDRLVLCCTGAKLEPTGAWVERAAVVRAQGTAAVVDAVVARWFTAGFAARCPDRVAAAHAMIAATPAEGYAACCDAIARADLRGRLGAIGAPTLVIAGAQDPATPPSYGAFVASAVSGARLVVLPDAAHLAVLEQPDAVRTLIEEHLS